ncbi:MAG: polyprenyl synthetase family protein [Calditrichia bacterium]
MDIFSKLQPLINTIQNRLQEDVKDEFPRTLKEPIYYFLETPGKKVRPLLTVLSCQAVGGNVSQALPAAVGIELLHDFTLIHDDIMDRDDLRRGRLTIHRRWDEGTAILVGDALVGMAYISMLRTDSRHQSRVLPHFSQALIKVCEGQALDKEFENRSEVSVDDYLDMIGKKTAWLFKLSCQIGAVLGGGTSRQVEALQQFGHHLGIGFQIQDDLLDYVADETKLGKKVGSDLKMDKKTYVALCYNEHLAAHPELQNKYPSRMNQFKTLDLLGQAIDELDIAGHTRRLAESHFEKALNYLAEVQPLTAENDLYQIVRFLQTRQY